ncbi:MAG: Ig-like domain-containing protein, partial [Pseudomonadota bacterium]
MKSMTGVLATLLLTTTGAFAAGPPTCTFNLPQNDPVSVVTGGSEIFQGTVSGGTPPYVVTLTFEGGIPAGANENLANSGDQTQQYDVSYAAAGTFTATMDANDSNKNPKSCSDTRTVTVSGNNNPPVAQNDEYNTQQDTQLVIAAPGVLGNDNDPDGDPMTAILDTDVASGILVLNGDGSFDYTPNGGFSGQDSFTYTANDAGSTSNVAIVTIGVNATGEVSINSTSANGFPVPGSAVSELDLSAYLPNPDYAIVAINDLGMHCGDLDTRISSVLPPFNVLHSQLILRGNGGPPRILDEGDNVEIFYSAASNPNDPAPSKVAGGQALSSVAADGTVYKTNFWDTVLQGAYDPFYPYEDPFGNIPIPLTPLAGIPFFVTTDVGLPMPDTTLLYLGDDGIPGTGDEALGASQQFMPSFNNTTMVFEPYVTNDPQVFHEHIGTLPFFINFPFGYTADVNLFEAAGTPISAFDDFGRENPYPLVKVHAEVNGTPVAAVDIVMPISGEAECQACHSADVGTGIAVTKLDGVGGNPSPAATLDDPLYDDLITDSVPFEVAVEWASDINLLRLHDLKHDTTLDAGFDPATGQSSDPVVCQTCHYTPALDLAQLGPLEGPPMSFANGRDQVKHKSMSNVMHSHHGSVDINGLSPGDLGYDANNLLIPIMPPAIDGQGNRRDPGTTQTILEETCYLCHPGKRTQCMRGAMANGGLVCQDCHGQMQDVGDDFTRNVTLANPGAFELGPDFYTNPALPRVPWANEPGCGSCHTGYANDNLAGDPNVLVSPTDTLGNTDGIRLLAAYRTNDPKATPIVPTNKAFAENVVTVDDLPGDPGAVGNPKLYRVSNGHGGLFCEACHGSTHAEWPASNPNANDNVPAKQIQG